MAGRSSTVIKLPHIRNEPQNIQNGEYKMNHSRRGRAIIFNHLTFKHVDMELEPRLGTDKDMVDFSSLLVNYGFEVYCLQDYSLEDIRNVIKAATYEDHENKDCILIAVFTHGRYGMLAARDQMYNYNILYEAFSPQQCRSLASKPKIFFIQACQVLGQEAEDNVKSCIPTFPDFVVAYSASPGSKAVRDESSGTWYMAALQKFLTKFAKGSSIEVMELLIHLNQIIHLKSSEHSKFNQMPFIVSTLTGKIRLTKERDEISPSLQPATPGGTTTDGQGNTSNVTAEIPVNVVTMINRQKPLEYELRPSRLKAIVFNHYKFVLGDLHCRFGALADASRLKSSLEKLGFDTKVYQDLTAHDIKKTLQTVSCDINEKAQTDCLLVMVSTFGGSGCLHAYDKPYPINYIWAPFREEKCPGLKGKPKIFLINSSKTNYVPHIYQTLGENSDFLFAFATVFDGDSLRDINTGALYIQAICEVIDETCYKSQGKITPPAFHDLLSTTHGKVKRKVESSSEIVDVKQIPCFASTCTHVIRFPFSSPSSGQEPSSSQTD